MTRAGAASAATALLVSLALLAAACAGAEERAGGGSDTAGDSYTPQAPAEPAPATTEPQPAPPPTEPPPPPEPPVTTRAAEEPAPPAVAEDPEPAPTVTEAAPTVTEAAPPEPIEATEPSPTGEPSDEEPVTSAAAGSLPGEPFEYGPEEGTSLVIVGVPYEEVLDLQAVPFGETIVTLDASNPYEGPVIVREAPSGEFLTSLHSWTGAIVATGRTRRLPGAAWPDAVWNEVRVAGWTGWARAAHLAPRGFTDPIATAQIIDILGETPQAHTLTDLALIVGKAFASDEPPSRVVVVTRPIVFEGLGEVTVDVLNIGDDSLLGFRLLVLANPEAEDWMSEDPGPFTLWIAERTILCHSHRGVNDEGLCI